MKKEEEKTDSGVGVHRENCKSKEIYKNATVSTSPPHARAQYFLLRDKNV